MIKIYPYIIFAVLVVAAVPAQAADGLLGSIEFKAQSLEALPKWRKLLERVNDEADKYDACEQNLENCKTQGMLSWRKFIEETKAQLAGGEIDDETLFQIVNSFINLWPYTTDMTNWNVSDYWATPAEFLDISGDCEDYAIIKYVTLKELGINFERLRLVVVRDIVRQLDHAVLAAYTKNNTPIIMDSLVDIVLPHEDMLQYTPYYSVNERTRWVHLMPKKN